MMRAVVVSGLVWLALIMAARANDISYAKDVGGVHLAGMVEIDDSSGDIVSVRGEASGVMSGAYSLDRVNLDARIAGAGGTLGLHLDRRNQAVSARLDGAEPVTVWQKP